jgi:tetratricopeptide (TPR) repeat protein
VGLGFTRRCTQHLKRYEEALVSFDRALELDANYQWAWAKRGDVLDNLKRSEEALASYDKRSNLRAIMSRAWFSRGWTLGKLGRYEEALASCDKAIETGFSTFICLLQPCHCHSRIESLG